MTGRATRSIVFKVRRAIVVATATVVLLAGAATWQIGFSPPAVEPLPVPERLVPLTAAEGRRLLTESPASTDYPPLAALFEAQRRRAFCGVASSVVVLNALRPAGRRLTQADFFDDLATELQVTFGGMTLQQLGQFLRRHGAAAEVVFAQETNVEAFRAAARANLGRPGDYVLVNYQRSTLGQTEGGHISPLAAYHAASDRFLVLDVAAYRYPPVWVPTVDLWNALNTVDTTSGRTRGFVLVRAS